MDRLQVLPPPTRMGTVSSPALTEDLFRVQWQVFGLEQRVGSKWSVCGFYGAGTLPHLPFPIDGNASPICRLFPPANTEPTQLSSFVGCVVLLQDVRHRAHPCHSNQHDTWTRTVGNRRLDGAWGWGGHGAAPSERTRLGASNTVHRHSLLLDDVPLLGLLAHPPAPWCASLRFPCRPGSFRGLHRLAQRTRSPDPPFPLRCFPWSLCCASSQHFG